MRVDPQRSSLRRLATVMLLAVVLPAGSAVAHSFNFVNVLLILKNDETFWIDAALNLDALALGLPSDTDPQGTADTLRAATPEELAKLIEATKAMLLRRVGLRVDDAQVALEVSFPEFGTALATASEHPTVLGVTARFAGRYFADA